MEIVNASNEKTIGRWEYDIKKDVILLSEGASYIYYNECEEKSVDIEDFFTVLSAKSSQVLARVLTDDKRKQVMFTQQVRCIDGISKKVLVIVSIDSSMSKNRYGLSIDVTKTL